MTNSPSNAVPRLKFFELEMEPGARRLVLRIERGVLVESQGAKTSDRGIGLTCGLGRIAAGLSKCYTPY